MAIGDDTAGMIGWEKALACVVCLDITYRRPSAQASAPQVKTQGRISSVYADLTPDPHRGSTRSTMGSQPSAAVTVRHL
jgi:hypothetical protein